MAITDDLNEGNDAARSLKQALQDIRDEATEAKFAFESMSGIIGKIAGQSKEFKDELKASGRSIKALSTTAQQLAKITKDDLEDKKQAIKLEKQALEARKRIAETQSQINVLNEKLVNATGEEEVRLKKVIEVMKDGVDQSEAIVRNFDKLNKTNERLAKETKFIDGLSKGLKTLPGLGPLLATPLENASKAYRSMRLKEGATKMDAMKEGAKGIADAFGPAFLLKSLLAVDKSTTQLAHSLQMSKGDAQLLKINFDNIALSSGKGYLNQRNLVEATSELVQVLGVANRMNDGLVENQAFLTKQMGLSAEEAGELAKYSTFTGKSAKQTNKEIANQVAQLQKETGIALKLTDVFKAVAKTNAGLQAAYGFNNELIAKQVVLTKALGLEVEQTAKMASQLLDFESSIAKELEAELLTGKDLNLEQARYLALQGKSTEAAAELAKQVGGTAELSRMNVLQQEALAEAMGMERNELIKSVQQREILDRLGKDSIADAAATEEGRQRLIELGGEQLLQQYEQESAAAKFQAAVVKIEEAFGNLMSGPFGNLVDGLANLLSSAAVLKTILYTIVGLSFARMIGSFATMIVQMFALSGAAAAWAASITLGIGLVAVVAGMAYLNSEMDAMQSRQKSKARNVNDFGMIGGSMNTNLDEGQLMLNTNAKDMVVMGGTKLFGNNNNESNERMIATLEKSNQIQEKILAKNTSPNITIESKNLVGYEQKQANDMNTYTTSV